LPESVFGTCYEKLAVAVEARGGELLLESTVTALETRDGRIHEVVLRDGRRFQPGHLIWSGNLLALARLLGKEPPPIRYLSTVLYNIEVEGEVLQKQRWIYYGGEDTKFSRVSVTTEMAPYMAPAGRTGLCVEVTGFEGEGAWKDPDPSYPRFSPISFA
jgi:phytoene dehydrogenase-like protein